MRIHPLATLASLALLCGAAPGRAWAQQLRADLDPLLDFPTVWKATQDSFEQLYVRREKERPTRPAQFEWLDEARGRARFSRQMFSNVETQLTLFSGQQKVEEAVVEFTAGRLARATISIYNRGDAGDMPPAVFEALVRRTGQALGERLKTTPRRQMATGGSAVKTVSWLWTTKEGVALLEHNDLQSGGTQGRPEYLRLKLAAADQADWSMGRMTLGVQRMGLERNVLKEPGGDVVVSNVPMVDQGAKGYCVAASCQRLFEYMRIPCDQHELAQLLSADVDRGVNALVMQKSLARVDGRFGVAFKPLVDPANYYHSGGERRVSYKRFTALLKEHLDKGTPLLWALELGVKPENPPLPADGQASGGHMRLITGYNLARGQVIFSDSWGAGHEKKRMSMEDAYAVTLGLYSLAPRGF